MAWNHNTESPKTELKKVAKSKCWVWLGLIIVFGGVSLWCLRPSRENDRQEPKESIRPTRIVEQKPTEVVKRTSDEKKAPEPEQSGVDVAKMTQSERDAYIASEIVKKPLRKASRDRPFRSNVENIMANIFTCRLGDSPPPLPRISLHELSKMQEILDSPDTIYDDDDERIAARKEAVAKAKKELAAFIDEGGKPEEFLKYYRDQLKVANQTWKAVQHEALQLIKNDPAAAALAIHEMNAKLAEQGIKPLHLPQPLLDEHGIKLSE